MRPRGRRHTRSRLREFLPLRGQGRGTPQPAGNALMRRLPSMDRRRPRTSNTRLSCSNTSMKQSSVAPGRGGVALRVGPPVVNAERLRPGSPVHRAGRRVGAVGRLFGRRSRSRMPAGAVMPQDRATMVRRNKSLIRVHIESWGRSRPAGSHPNSNPDSFRVDLCSPGGRKSTQNDPKGLTSYNHLVVYCFL